MSRKPTERDFVISKKKGRFRYLTKRERERQKQYIVYIWKFINIYHKREKKSLRPPLDI